MLSISIMKCLKVTVLILTLSLASVASHSQQVSPPSSNVSTLLSDLNEFLNYLPGHWANQEFNEKFDGYQLSDRISAFKNQLAASPPKIDSDFFIAVDLFIRGLHDGHMALTGVNPQLMFSLTSGLTFAFTQQGIALIGCDSTRTIYPCQDLNLPVLVDEIDGVDASGWIQGRAQLEIGTMPQGRSQAALKSLSSTGWRIRGEYEPARTLSLKDSRGSEITLPFFWTNSVPATVPTAPNGYSGAVPPIAQGVPEPLCVFSTEQGSVLILRVQTFECTRTFNEAQSVMDTRFNQQLASALANKSGISSVLIDLRNNGGGLDSETRALGAQFFTQPTFWYRISNLIADSWSTPFDNVFTPTPGSAVNPVLLNTPLWLLTNGGCFSACSMFVRELHNSGRAKIIGTSMDGGVGGPRPWKSSSGLLSISVPSIKLWDNDGTPMEDSSITPDIYLLPNISDFVQQSDAELNLAINTLQKMK